MQISKEGEQVIEVVLTPNDVESAIRQFICDCNPEYSKGWLLDVKYNIGSVVFVGTKDN